MACRDTDAMIISGQLLLVSASWIIIFLISIFQMGEGLTVTEVVIEEAIGAVLTNEGTMMTVHHEG